VSICDNRSLSVGHSLLFIFILLLQYETVMMMNLSYLLVLFESLLVVKSSDKFLAHSCSKARKPEGFVCWILKEKIVTYD